MGKVAVRWTLTVLVLAVYTAGAWVFGSQTPVYHLYRSSGPARVTYERAQVVSVPGESLDRDDRGLLTGYQDLQVRILSGPRAGTLENVRNYLNYTTNYRLGPGSEIVAHVDEADADHSTVSVYTPDRTGPILLLVLAFTAVLCGVGGWRGVRSLLGILFTFTSLLFLFIPMLYRGWSPVWAAVLVTSATACVSLVLLDGVRVKTLAAVLGTLVGLGVSALLEALFQWATLTSGLTTPEADSLCGFGGLRGQGSQHRSRAPGIVPVGDERRKGHDGGHGQHPLVSVHRGLPQHPDPDVFPGTFIPPDHQLQRPGHGNRRSPDRQPGGDAHGAGGGLPGLPYTGPSVKIPSGVSTPVLTGLTQIINGDET